MTERRFLARSKAAIAAALTCAVIAPAIANATPPDAVRLPPPACSLDAPCDLDSDPWEWPPEGWPPEIE